MSQSQFERGGDTTFQSLVKHLWHGFNPYAGFPLHLYENDMTGWNSGHGYLSQAVDATKAQIVIEIGVWKGLSTITLAKALQYLKLDGCVISIDTWRGSSEHWAQKESFEELCLENAEPRMMRKFLQNIVTSGLKDFVIPLPLDSVNAAVLLEARGISADVIHIDAGHDYRSVYCDIEIWWPLLRPGGILIGDDYKPASEGGFVEVRRAFDDFFVPLGLSPIENYGAKCRITKPGA